MVLDEIRIMAAHKKEELMSDKNTPARRIKLADEIIELFSNVDYIAAAPKSLIHQSLLFVGYEFDDMKKIYEDLMKEVNKKYKVVSPEQIAEAMDKSK
ncbi:MAG: hypothetical protein IJG97_02350 [Bacilli bacterium]|nr:hypothetical protein [Bacilli bacterium]